jgi:hypothetical protein
MEGAYLVWHEYETEQETDETKFIGATTTQEKADATVDSLRGLAGFVDHPSGFVVEFCKFNRTGWTEGFVRIPRGQK